MNWATVGCLAQLGDKAQSLSKDREGGGGGGQNCEDTMGHRTPAFLICWGLHSVFEYSWSSTCLAHFNPHNMQRYLIPNGAKVLLYISHTERPMSKLNSHFTDNRSIYIHIITKISYYWGVQVTTWHNSNV